MGTATEHRKKLELKANVPVDVRFKFATPVECEGKYGPYQMWTVVQDGEDVTLFATNGLKEALREAGPEAGEVLQITKAEKQGGKGFTYVVERPGGSAKREGSTKQENGSTKQANGGNGEQASIRAYVGRYVNICKELSRQWPEVHEKDAELFRSAVGCIYIQMSKSNGNGH